MVEYCDDGGDDKDNNVVGVSLFSNGVDDDGDDDDGDDDDDDDGDGDDNGDDGCVVTG